MLMYAIADTLGYAHMPTQSLHQLVLLIQELAAEFSSEFIG